jgi:hypothetical protein
MLGSLLAVPRVALATIFFFCHSKSGVGSWCRTWFSGVLVTRWRATVPDAEFPAQESLSAALGSVARTLQGEPDVDSTVAAIVRAAVDHVDGAEYAGSPWSSGAVESAPSRRPPRW